MAQLHKKIGREHGLIIANRVATLVRTVYIRAIDEGDFKGENPAARVKLNKEKPRTRFLTTAELARINQALAAEPNIYWRSFFALLLLLGPRKNDLLSARWDDIDFDAGTWRITMAKSGRENLLPMPDAAQSIFADLQKLSGQSPWVFPSVGKTGHLVEPRRQWMNILERAQV